MAGLDSKPRREFKCTAVKKANDILQGFVDSLANIVEEETSFDTEVDVVNRDHIRGLTYRLKILENLVKSFREHVPGIQEILAGCDEILSSAGDSSAAQGALRMGSIANVGVGGVSKSNTKLNPVKQRRARRHYCAHREGVMDSSLWRKLPREVVQHICAFLPLSETLKLQKLIKPWSRMPLATNFRQSCAEAHQDLFGIVTSNGEYGSHCIAVTNSKHTEWLHLDINYMIPSGLYDYVCRHKELFAHDGGLISIFPNSFECLKSRQDFPSIRVFNPLTGDGRDIPLSNFTSSKAEDDDLHAVLLQLIVDSKTGCYELVLVTQSGRYESGAEVYWSEKYDSKSKLWSTLDSGIVFGEGVLDTWRCAVYFDCCLKQLCRNDGQPFEPFEKRAIVWNPHSLAFVKNHRFEIGFVNQVGHDRDYSLLHMSESVWESGWITRSTASFAMEEPRNDLQTKILACERYILVVADDAPSDVFEHRHQRMLLYDRQTCREAYDIPNFWREYDIMEYGGKYFIDEQLHVMCDLNWTVVP